MDYQTARNLLIAQVMDAPHQSDALLTRLTQGQPPIPGHVTTVLLALKVVFEALKDATQLDRELVYSLYLFALKSRQAFEDGKRAGVDWPPLLNEDLERIARSVKSIFAGEWYEAS